ncbi:MAG TPA: hypothetical protein VKS80_00715, partial [Trinickia sp.]|nr:hypothetical protein [Trinickia sp.]
MTPPALSPKPLSLPLDTGRGPACAGAASRLDAQLRPDRAARQTSSALALTRHGEIDAALKHHVRHTE